MGFLELKDNPFSKWLKTNSSSFLPTSTNTELRSRSAFTSAMDNKKSSTLWKATNLAWVPTPLGELILLGSQGRRVLKLSPYYKSPPEAAATQLVQRRVGERLEAQGWIYRAKVARNLLVFATDEGKPAYVLARYGDYTARSVRRVLATYKSCIISESAVLVVVTRSPHRLKKLVEKHRNLVTTLYLKY